MGAVIIIPARFAATRFPGKPLAPIAGKPMIQWVVERCLQADVGPVLVATDDVRIQACVEGFGGTAVITSNTHENGTQRIAEVAQARGEQVCVNVQGDEPMIDPHSIQTLVDALHGDPTLEMATLAAPIRDHDEIFDPNAVKVVRDGKGDALYFSRAPIPYRRHAQMRGPRWPQGLDGDHLKHIGVYAYRRSFLLRFAATPSCDLERWEGLEQLRALHMGARIRVDLISTPAMGVDTPEDITRVEAQLRQRGLT